MRVSSTVLLLVGVLVTPLAAQAQDTPRLEVAAGYAFLRDQDTALNFPVGWVASASGKITSSLGIVGAAGGSYKTLSIPGDHPKLRVYAFMGGPRYTVRAKSKMPLFGQVLFGSARASSRVSGVGDSVRDFAYQPGGGVDLRVRSNMGVQLEGDYRIIRSHGSNSKEPRFVTAIVLGFGR